MLTPFFPGMTQRQTIKSVFPLGRTIGVAYVLLNSEKFQTEKPAG